MEALVGVGVFIVVVGLIYFLCFSPRSQALGYFSYRKKTTEKVVAFTFDDGPNPPHTQKILDILATHHIQATFFVVGKNLEKYPDLGRAMVSAGHVIGNHSYHHSFWEYLKHPAFELEITRTQALIQRSTGKTAALFRPPWLFRHPGIFRTLRRNNLTPVSGVFGSYLEVFQIPAEKLAARVMSKVKPGTILIFHDGFNARGGNRAQTAEAINLLIPKLLAAGCQFVTVDRLLGVPAYQENNGTH